MIAAVIGDIVVFYNSKNLNCIGALFLFFKDLFTHFHDFNFKKISALIFFLLAGNSLQKIEDHILLQLEKFFCWPVIAYRKLKITFYFNWRKNYYQV